MAFISSIYKKIKGNNNNLYNKHVVVTGGSSGIGQAIATLAVEVGAHVTVIARDMRRLKETEVKLRANSMSQTQQISIISLDLTNYDDVEKCLNEIDNTLPIYMLINCAGMSICGKVEDMPINETEEMMNTNFYGTYFPTKAIVPKMKARKEGYIIITGSQASLIGIFGFSSYSASKFALRGFAEALDMEVKPYNINVTLALPPDTNTPGFEKENLTKLEETRLISESAGLFQPEDVAARILLDALDGKFMSSFGVESFMLTTLCSGMTRQASLCELMLQSILLGPFKIIAAFYLYSFDAIIKKVANKKEKKE